MKEQNNENWRKKSRRKDGSFKVINGNKYARIQFKDEITGKRREKLVPIKNRTEAHTKIKEMRSELQNHGAQILNADKLLFKDLASRFEKIKLIEAVYADGLKVAGLRSVNPLRSALKPLVAHFGNTAVKNIKTSDLEAYKLVRIKTPVVKEINTKVPNESAGRKKHMIVKTRVETPRKIATINRELQLLRAIFRFALSDKIISRSPFENHSIISTAAEVQRERVLSVEEEERLLEQCTDQRGHLRALIITAVDTAMRFGELIKLKWNDVNLEQRTITLLATNTKIQKMRRIGMTPRIQAELQRLWDISDQDNNSLVFGIKSTIKRSWKSACEAADIEDFHFHDLRHTATTRFVFTGMSQAQAMKLTGHTQTKTFLRYMNPTDENIVAAADMLSDYNERQVMNRQSQTVSVLIN